METLWPVIALGELDTVMSLCAGGRVAGACDRGAVAGLVLGDVCAAWLRPAPDWLMADANANHPRSIPPFLIAVVPL